MNSWKRVLQAYEALPVKEFACGTYYDGSVFCAVGSLDPEFAKTLSEAMRHANIRSVNLADWRCRLWNRYKIGSGGLELLQKTNDTLVRASTNSERYAYVVASIQSWIESPLTARESGYILNE